MEEVKAAVAPPFPPATKKRPLDSNGHSTYLKIRAVIRDLRPQFLEVIRTPDYKKCKAAREIQERTTLVPDDATMSMISSSFGVELKIVSRLCESMKDDQSKAGQNIDQKTPKEQQSRPSEIKLTPPVPGFQQQPVEDGLPGTYVVGGSAFGWNFITFSGKDPVYCGRSKEEFRTGKASK
ncbi:uncharacterized protein HKW66_Vig0112590 [Vigna angularis]|uniref:Uncharacterized protein n=1 Tax=Phaseolus angularis TaxID=3914 RepID=A0A8T0KWK1_PHAAN|nr:uncharacterized protein HKW66_Vig0112590 [Vigna angularis]